MPFFHNTIEILTWILNQIFKEKAPPTVECLKRKLKVLNDEILKPIYLNNNAKNYKNYFNGKIYTHVS